LGSRRNSASMRVSIDSHLTRQEAKMLAASPLPNCAQAVAMAVTLTQQTILERAAKTSAGKIAWFPAHIKGVARNRVLAGLFKRALVAPEGGNWWITAQGYEALGHPQPSNLAPLAAPRDADLETDVAKAEASWKKPT
jgi:hypothetical protein